MSNNNADVLPVNTAVALDLRRVDSRSYMAGKWSGYGYVAVIQVLDVDRFAAHGLAGTVRNIRGVQSVVHKSDKIHMGGPTEERADSDRDAWMDDVRRANQERRRLEARGRLTAEYPAMDAMLP